MYAEGCWGQIVIGTGYEGDLAVDGQAGQTEGHAHILLGGALAFSKEDMESEIKAETVKSKGARQRKGDDEGPWALREEAF